MQPAGEIEKLNDQEMLPIFQVSPREPDPVQLYVVGGFVSGRSMVCGGSIATEKIDVPAEGDKLVSKYRDIVPTYLRYHES